MPEIITRSEAKARGLKRYFTGRPCKHGHVCERRIQGGCIECEPAFYREKGIQWRRQNRNRLNAISRRYYQKNAEVIKLRVREWDERNKDKKRELGRAGSHRYRARKLGNGGTHCAADIKLLYELQSGRCAYHFHCKSKLLGKYHVDHIQPLSKGGSNGPENLQLLCAPCNLSKNASDPIEYVQKRLGRLL